VWRELALTKGFGTYHLSEETVRTLREVDQRAHGLRRVNNRFGEGASPRLRQTRGALDSLGIDSAQVLHHASKRISYACELFPGAIEELMGLCPSSTTKGNSVKTISDAWRRRWLIPRLRNPELQEKLEMLGPSSVRAELSMPNEEGQWELALG
jgi:hypothetical protein